MPTPILSRRAVDAVVRVPQQGLRGPALVLLGGLLQLRKAWGGTIQRLLRQQPRGVPPLASATPRTSSTNARLCCSASPENRGICERRSYEVSNVVDAFTVPVQNPFPGGLNGTKSIPSSAHGPPWTG
jgi:hypothetical protein